MSWERGLKTLFLIHSLTTYGSLHLLLFHFERPRLKSTEFICFPPGQTASSRCGRGPHCSQLESFDNCWKHVFLDRICLLLKWRQKLRSNGWKAIISYLEESPQLSEDNFSSSQMIDSTPLNVRQHSAVEAEMQISVRLSSYQFCACSYLDFNMQENPFWAPVFCRIKCCSKKRRKIWL